MAKKKTPAPVGVPKLAAVTYERELRRKAVEPMLAPGTP